MIDKDYISPWKTYLNSKFKQDITDIPTYNMNCDDYPVFKDPFYNDLFDTWTKYMLPNNIMQSKFAGK